MPLRNAVLWCNIVAMSERFRGEVRKASIEHVRTWEEGIKNPEAAKASLKLIKHILHEHGLSIGKRAHVLEVGSGLGLLLQEMRAAGINSVGVDARPRGEEKRLIGARIEQLPFGDALFDLVLSNAVFDANVYDQDQAAMLLEIARVLKIGGVLYLNGVWGVHNLKDFEKAGLVRISAQENQSWGALYKKQ